MSHIEDAMKMWMGPRCSDLEPDCAACQGWAEVDEIDRLRAKLTVVEDAHETSIYQHREAYEAALQAQAAIARVRELCRDYDPSDPGTAYYSRGDVLRALEGDTE